MFNAEEARQLGLIQRVVGEGGNVLTAAREWAADLVTLPREALAATKRLVYATHQLSGADLTRMEANLFVELWETPDHVEALNAFGAKRPPVFNQDWIQKPESE
jgi:enoyl-CoA hydratase/carnithine racemase